MPTAVLERTGESGDNGQVRESSPRRRLWCALVLVLAAGCRHGPLPTTIAIGPKQELIAHARIGNASIKLQLDTGASTTSLSPTVCRRLGIPFGHTAYEPPATGGGAGGALRDVKWTLVSRFQLADEVFYMQPLAVIELDTAGGAIDGVLGMDVLGQYILDVDLGAREFALRDQRDTSFRAADLVAASYRPLVGGQIGVTVAIDGRPTTAVLDLGSNRTLANRLALEPDDHDETISAAIGADGNRAKFHAASDVRLDLGELELHAPSVWISDLPIFGTFGLADRPAVVLGTDALAGRRVVIDPFARQVYVSR